MTTLTNNLAQVERHVYAIRSTIIPAGGQEADAIDVGDLVTELRIVKDFDGASMPYFRMTVGVSRAVADRIRACWRSAKLTLTVSRRVVPRDGEGIRPIDAFHDILDNVEFRILETSLDNPPPAPPESAAPTDEATEATAYLGTLELVPAVSLAINRAVLGGAYHNTTVANLVALLCKRVRPSAPGYKMWFMPPDNERTYESLVLPPLSFVQSLKTVDRVYGLYKGKLTVFLDYDALYVLNSARSIQPGPKDPQMVVLEVRPQQTQTPGTTYGSAYDEESRTHRLRHFGPVDLRVEGPGARESEGGHVRLVRATHRERTGTNCKDIFPEIAQFLPGGDATTKKMRVLWQTYDNELTADRMRLEARERYAELRVQLDSPNLAALSPVLQWRVEAEGDAQRQELEGYWRLSGVEISLTQSPKSDEPADAVVLARLRPVASGR